VEVGWEAPLRLQLIAGTAEVFGTELPPTFWLSFPPAFKFAVFTWHGATIELDGVSEVAYVADEVIFFFSACGGFALEQFFFI
jgi:polyribonucleotide 5'-hydroxyl-kinase